MRCAPLLFCLCLLVDLIASAGEPVRVVTWNLQWFPGWKPEASAAKESSHIDLARKALIEIQPDILILEEIKKPDVVRTMLEAVTGLQVHVVTEFSERAQQIMIASRYPAVHSGWQDWLKAGLAPSRGFAWADLELKKGVVLHVQGHHWKSNRGIGSINRTLRTISAMQVDEWIAGRVSPNSSRTGLLVAGDLNTSLDSPEMQPDPSLRYLLGRGWYWPFAHLAPDARCTIEGGWEHPPAHFDHILLKNTGKPLASVLRKPGVSDHSPVLIEISPDEIRTSVL